MNLAHLADKMDKHGDEPMQQFEAYFFDVLDDLLEVLPQGSFEHIMSTLGMTTDGADPRDPPTPTQVEAIRGLNNVQMLMVIAAARIGFAHYSFYIAKQSIKEASENN